MLFTILLVVAVFFYVFKILYQIWLQLVGVWLSFGEIISRHVDHAVDSDHSAAEIGERVRRVMLEDINVATMTKNLKQELGTKDAQHGTHLHRFDVAVTH